MTLEEEKKEKKRLYDIEYRIKNKVKITERARNKYQAMTPEEKIKINKERYAKLDKEKKKLTDKEYAINNKNKLNKKKKDWAIANPEKHKKAKYDYVKKKMKADSFYRLKEGLKTSIRASFQKIGYTKKSRTQEILGCSYEEFRDYIECKFEEWMNWNNRGNWNGIPSELNTAWDIDHIIPLSTAETEDDVIKLNHYTNLQPLCSYVNRWIKSDNHLTS